MGKLLSVSLRQGMFLGCIVTMLLLLHIFGLFSWWIGLMVFLVFFLIELALHA